MKQGELIEVFVGGIPVTHATVADIDITANTVTLFIPETTVIAGLNMSITDETPAPEVDRALANETVVREERQRNMPEPEDNPYTAAPEPTKSLREMSFDSSVIDKNPDD